DPGHLLAFPTRRSSDLKTLIWVTLAIAVFGLCWVPMLSSGNAGVMAWLIIGFSLMGMTFGPMGALLPELFPANVRYTGSGISYKDRKSTRLNSSHVKSS